MLIKNKEILITLIKKSNDYLKKSKLIHLVEKMIRHHSSSRMNINKLLAIQT